MMTRNHSEEPAGADDVDEELTAWEELLTADPNAEIEQAHERWNVEERRRDDDMESVRGRWGSSDSERVREEWAAGREEDAPRGATENLARMDYYESRFPDPVEDTSVIRVICGALDPRTFNSKIRWAAIVVTLMLGIIIPFMLGRHLALWAGVPSMWAAIIGGTVTLAYWKYF